MVLSGFQNRSTIPSPVRRCAHKFDALASVLDEAPTLYRIVIDHSWPRDTLWPMATDIREQMETRFRMAHDEYIAAIRAHREALELALKTESADVNQEFDRASASLQRKQEAYLRATDDLRSLGSQQ
jgi:hypothetical protein